MEDLNITIAGSAGEGVETIGSMMDALFSRRGYAVFSWREYESRIRGGQNSYNIRVSEAIANAPLRPCDILLGLNPKAIQKYQVHVKPEGLILAAGETDDTANDNMVEIPFVKIAKEAGDKIYSNAAASGVLASVLGVESDALDEVIAKQFSGKAKEVIQANQKAAQDGRAYALDKWKGRKRRKMEKRDPSFGLITGTSALALGAAQAGCRFMAAYPMTPSTGIINYFAKNQQKLGIFTEQAEDEIAAINMAVGAGYAGARAMTATSGGGFALMTEGISLAGMTETPVVIVLAQRPGPATGLPTRTAQGDLLFAVHAGHGEFPKLVMAPADPEDAFHQAVRAFNLADKYQIPVVVLTDQFLADSHFSLDAIAAEESQAEYFGADPSQIDAPYRRYEWRSDGVSPRLYPGQGQHLVGADSDEHDPSGHITEDLETVAPDMLAKRLAKEGALRKEMRPPEEINTERADIILVGWGSARGALAEVVQKGKQNGHSLGMIHFTEIWPPPEYEFPSNKQYISVEGNAKGQLARLLRAEYDVRFDSHIGRTDGLPLTAAFIQEVMDDKIR